MNNNNELAISLYDLNKQAYSQEKPLNPIALGVCVQEMIVDIMSRDSKGYWMLLCKDREDYTVFHLMTIEGIIRDMKETLLNRGSVLDIKLQKDGNYEIWIRDNETKENFAYYFFDYNFGIVEA